MADHVIAGVTLVGETIAPISARLVNRESFAPGNVLLCPTPTPRDFAQVIVSAAMLCTKGGRTGHIPSICRARGIPVILIDQSDLHGLRAGGEVLVEPRLGTVTLLREGTARPSQGHALRSRRSGLAPMEAAVSAVDDIKRVNDGDVSALVDSFFIREEFLWTAKGLWPDDTGSAPDHVDIVRAELGKMLRDLKAHQTLTFRLLDLRSDDEFKMSGQRRREPEPNPELGLHGARRILTDVGYQQAASRLLNEPSLDDVTFSIPFLNDEVQLTAIFNALRVTDPRRWGVFIETPAAVFQLPRILDTGISVINVGTKDLVQFMLAADRNNHLVANHYDTRHPSVMNALAKVAEACAGYPTVLRVYTLGADLDYYRSYLPDNTKFMMCAHELRQLQP